MKNKKAGIGGILFLIALAFFGVLYLITKMIEASSFLQSLPDSVHITLYIVPLGLLAYLSYLLGKMIPF